MKIPSFKEFIFNGSGASPDRERVDLLKIGEEDTNFLQQFKALRSKLEYKLDLLAWKVIGVTSSIAGEGKTLTCAKLAVSLARTKRKSILLIDADIRQAELSKGFGNPRHPGLTEYLLGGAVYTDIVRKTVVPGLDTISSGALVADSADLLAGDSFRIFVEEARKRYDLVLLDTPPILPVADTMAMREQLDGLIFLYRAGYTPLQMFLQATEEIGEKKILGVVLNGVEPKSDRYYGKYYGHYYTSLKNKETGE